MQAQLAPGSRYTRAQGAVLVGVPLAWAVLLLFHPTGDGDQFYPIVRDEVTPWLVVHVGTLLLLPLLAATIFVLLHGIGGTAAMISRVAVVVFAVLYTAFEVLVGIGVGVLTDEINALPAGQQAVGSDLVQSYVESGLVEVFEIGGSLGWLVAVAAAGVALFERDHRRSSLAVVGLFVVSAPGIIVHVTPVGPVGLALFVVALLLILQRSRPSAELAPPFGQPRPA